MIFERCINLTLQRAASVCRKFRQNAIYILLERTKAWAQRETARAITLYPLRSRLLKENLHRDLSGYRFNSRLIQRFEYPFIKALTPLELRQSIQSTIRLAKQGERRPYNAIEELAKPVFICSGSTHAFLIVVALTTLIVNRALSTVEGITDLEDTLIKGYFLSAIPLVIAPFLALMSAEMWDPI